MVSTGIQRLVSTYELPIFSSGGGSEGGEGVGVTPDQLKLKVPRSAQIFIGGGGGVGGYSRPTFLKYFSGGT